MIVPRTFAPGLLSVPVGFVVSRCHVQVGGVGSTFPAGSIERTSNGCWLSARPLIVFGLVHGFQEPPSTRHWNVEPASLEVNVNVDVLLGSPGAPVMFVNGGFVSIETLR